MLVITLKALGYSDKEISEKTGYEMAWVGQILRQPWARERLVREIKNAGRDALQTLLAGEAEASIWKLVEVRDNSKKGAEVIAASNSLLDRLLGKPNQAIQHSMKVEVEKLSDEELLKIASQGAGAI